MEKLRGLGDFLLYLLRNRIIMRAVKFDLSGGFLLKYRYLRFLLLHTCNIKRNYDKMYIG